MKLWVTVLLLALSASAVSDERILNFHSDRGQINFLSRHANVESLADMRPSDDTIPALWQGSASLSDHPSRQGTKKALNHPKL